MTWLIVVVGHAAVRCRSLTEANDIFNAYKRRGYTCFVEARSLR